MLTASRLRELLEYDPQTGLFRRRTSRAGRTAGSIAGNISGDGYWHIGVDGGTFLGHRLAWLYMHGEWPPNQLDHVDRDRTNNRFANLRPATNSQNCANSRRPDRNISGLKGASYKGAGMWGAQIMKDQKNLYLGRFSSPEEAHEAYMRAARELFGEFARAD